MSSITFSGNPTGSAVFTVQSPPTNTSRTLTLPDAAGSLLCNPLTPSALGTQTAGLLEYDGTAGYFTSVAGQRGVLPGMQFYRLNAPFAGANATGVQSLFGVGVTLAANTVYAFQTTFILSKSAGLQNHTISLLFGGTATVNNILYSLMVSGGFNQVDASAGSINATQATAVTMTSSISVASVQRTQTGQGTVSIGTGGTFIPQYSLSTAPGGAYSTLAGSFFAIWPVGAAGANTSVGSWA